MRAELKGSLGACTSGDMTVGFIGGEAIKVGATSETGLLCWDSHSMISASKLDLRAAFTFKFWVKFEWYVLWSSCNSVCAVSLFNRIVVEHPDEPLLDEKLQYLITLERIIMHHKTDFTNLL